MRIALVYIYAHVSGTSVGSVILICMKMDNLGSRPTYHHRVTWAYHNYVPKYPLEGLDTSRRSNKTHLDASELR